MFECLLCKKSGVKFERRNLVPHITRNHPEIENSTKQYMAMFPGAKLREPPKTSFLNKDHMKKAVSKSIKTRTGQHLSKEHRKSIGESNKVSEKHKKSRIILSARYESGELSHSNKLTEDKMPISEEELYNMYCVQKKSAMQIGKEIDRNNKTVKKYLDFYNIQSRGKYDGQMLHFLDGESMKPLTDYEKDIIEGELLGDGCLNMDPERNKNHVYRHSCKYSEYILWIQSLLPNVRWPEKISDRKDSRTGKIYYGVSSKIHPDFKEIHNRFYGYNEEKKKITKKIPKDLILTPVKLLHWFLGDGCLWRDKEKKKLWHIYIATQGFDREDLEFIVKPQMIKMGIDCKVKKGKNGPELIIYAKSFERFYEVIGAKSPVSCYNYKFKIVKEKFQHLIKPNSLDIKILSKEGSVNAYFDHYRKNGFPFPFLHLDLQNRMDMFLKFKDIDSGKLVDGDMLKISKEGTGLVNFYHNHMFSIKTKGRKNSVIDVFNDDDKLKKVLEKVYDSHGRILDGTVRSRLVLSSTYKPFNFRPLLAKYIVENYSKDGDTVLDPCSGFGGRLMGCMSVPDRSYYGVEPENATYDGLNRMIQDLQLQDKAIIHHSNFENASLDGNFGLIFTSPPYYDVEIYGPGNKKQSHEMYKSYDEWKIGFLSTFVEKSYRLLRKGGHFCVVVNNTKDYPIADDFEEIARKYFTLVKKYRIQYNTNPFELKRTGEKFKYEPLFVFRKKM